MIWKTEYTGKNNMTKNLKPRLKCLQMRLVFLSFFLSFIYLFIFFGSFPCEFKEELQQSYSWMIKLILTPN